MALITPTIGRKVWFWPVQEDLEEGVVDLSADEYFRQPLDATIVYVHGDQLVNLHVLDHEGNAWKFEKVLLLEGSRPESFPVRCATWMPYQLDQAQKNAKPNPQVNKAFAFSAAELAKYLSPRPISCGLDLTQSR